MRIALVLKCNIAILCCYLQGLNDLLLRAEDSEKLRPNRQRCCWKVTAEIDKDTASKCYHSVDVNKIVITVCTLSVILNPSRVSAEIAQDLHRGL